MVDPQIIVKEADDRHGWLHEVLGTTVEAIVSGIYHQCVHRPISSPLYHCVDSPFLFRIF